MTEVLIVLSIGTIAVVAYLIGYSRGNIAGKVAERCAYFERLTTTRKL